MMDQALEKFNQEIESLALEAVMLEAGDIPGLGAVLKSLASIENLILELKEESLSSIVGTMKGYIEMVILGERSELSPFEAGISQLQEICRNLINGQAFNKDLSPLLASLGFEGIEPSAASLEHKSDTVLETGAAFKEPETTALKPDDRKTKTNKGSQLLSAEDLEIITDFVAESLENLGTIEINVVNLEQDPSDPETLNAIFRPFHTIKGVSGFLNFNKINKLSHAVENLLDKARNAELQINEKIIDVILDCVDLAQRMIENVQATMNSGTPEEGELDIKPYIDRVEHFVNQAEEGERKPLGKMLIEKGTISKGDLQEALHLQKEQQKKKIGEILIEDKKVEAGEVVSALREQKKTTRPVALQVKIDTDKLDNVIDMVGELAIAQSMLRQNEVVEAGSSRKLDNIINQLDQITSGLQRTTMALRMEPIKNTFRKMLRLVRDLAKKAGKDVQLVMEGENTEIDRNMVEEIYAPMVHIIRNSIDHGMELPDERKAAGKPAKGTINLKAYHKGGDIVIEIEDDGRGLNREKIWEKALSKGIVPAGEKLTEGEINNLIFHPGFSTAEKVTDVSGRGVGMDVVKSKIIERLRGRVDIQSTRGQGTTILMRLPLTLAILDGMVVRLNGERYIIPTLAVQESLRPQKGECYTVKGEGEMIRVRDSLIPLIRLDRLLDLNGNESASDTDKALWEKLVVVVENQERRRCLLIDELLGQEEVVIKSIGETFKDVKGIAGGAIMGDGRVSLILDIAEIADITSERQ
ncbi:MAG: chemotaxis protein CheA [Candidatus Desulfatibia sp.]|uniref:chemotaxis protein CheA n=1 Tax=Candidatus Desulfatibia sp. TaxID=3101189 RepID=UPI002F3470F3